MEHRCKRPSESSNDASESTLFAEDRIYSPCIVKFCQDLCSEISEISKLVEQLTAENPDAQRDDGNHVPNQEPLDLVWQGYVNQRGERCERQIQLYGDECRDLHKQLRHSRQEVRNSQEEVRHLQQEVKNLQQNQHRLDVQDVQLTNAKQKFEELSAEYHRIQKELDMTRALVREKSHELEESAYKLRSAERMHQQKDAELESANAELKSANADIDRIKQELNNAKSVLEESAYQLRTTERMHQQKDAELKSANAEIDRIKQELTDAKFALEGSAAREKRLCFLENQLKDADFESAPVHCWSYINGDVPSLNLHAFVRLCHSLHAFVR